MIETLAVQENKYLQLLIPRTHKINVHFSLFITTFIAAITPCRANISMEKLNREM